MAIIESILDNDLYKFTMQNFVCKLYPRSRVHYSFIDRRGTTFPDGFVTELREEIQHMKKLRLKPSERVFLEKNCPFLDPLYLDFLWGYRFNPDAVEIHQHDGRLEVEIEGLWGREILWEVPVMAMISELYFKMTGQEGYIDFQTEVKKAQSFTGLSLADFGTRRRFSYDNHNRIVGLFNQYCSSFVGTSNVHLAMIHDLRPIGTMAHELFQAHAVMFGFEMANRMALDRWVDIYRGDLGIALSDTYTSDVFYRDFDMKLAKLFDGVRQDSGDPFSFVDKTISHYEGLGIDPSSKTIVFSDGLDVNKARKIEEYVCANSQIKTAYGIGTNLTNDVGAEPLNMVIKMVGFQPTGRKMRHAVKLSDSPGKHTGNSNMVNLCKHTLEVE